MMKTFKTAMKYGQRVAYGAAIGLVASQAQAAVDVTAITGVLADVAAVGAAIFGVFVAIKAVKIIRAAL